MKGGGRVKKIRAAAAFIMDMVRTAGRHSVPRSAAALAYFFLLSFFPLLLCINAFVGLFHVDAQELIASVGRFLPPQAAELARDYVQYLSQNQSPALLLVGVPGVLLPASAGLRVLLDTMDELYEHPRETGIKRIAGSVFFSLLFLVTVYLSIVVILTGDWFLGFVEDILPGELSVLWDFSGVAHLWRWLRYVLLFCFVMLLVLALYRLGTPKQHVHPGPMLLSALLCALSLVGASAVFSRFIAMSSRYSVLYGSLASLIILLLWLYLCGAVLLAGAVFNRVWTK